MEQERNTNKRNSLHKYSDAELIYELQSRGYEVYRWDDELEWEDDLSCDSEL